MNKPIAPRTGYYKYLGQNGEPCNGGRGRWPLPNGKPGAWLTVKGELEPCQRGLHLCRPKDLLNWIGPTLWRVEIRGDMTRLLCDDKVVVRSARLLYQVETWTEQSARLLAADCAERALNLVGNPDPRSLAAVVATRRYAFGLISDAARAAASAAASDAAWAAASDAARDAARAAARDAARAAARAAAPRDAARAAARAAARDAAWAAAWDAAWAAARAAASAAARAAARAAAWAAAWDAAWAAEKRWQTKRLFEYLNDRIDLTAIRESVG
jgi:hypothetical protein